MSRPPRTPALDGLRGLAVLLVLLAHASNVGLRLHPALDLSGCGRMGVFLFFVLSAFLLTDQLLSSDTLAAPSTWLRYGVRRLLRVYPAYVAWLFLYFALRERVPVQPMTDWSLEDVGRHLLLVRGDRHLWTIPIELRWYLVLPLVVGVVVLLGGRTLTTVLALGAVGVASRVVFPASYPGPPLRPFELGPFVPVFLCGSLAAVLNRGWRLPPRTADAVVLAAALGLLLHVPALWGVDHRYFHLDFDRIGLLWGALLLGLLHGGGALRRPFETGALRFVGRVSYSAYLGHELVLLLVESPGRSWPQGAALIVFLVGSLLVGWASHLLLERPFARLWATPRSERLAAPQTRR